jgi:hypothetical protein
LDVIESEYLFNLRRATLTASAALMSHADAELDGADARLQKMVYNTMTAIPYVTGGKTADDMENEDRAAFVERFEQYRKRVMAKEPPPQPEKIKIRRVGR